jgi:hypothetical protein
MRLYRNGPYKISQSEQYLQNAQQEIRSVPEPKYRPALQACGARQQIALADNPVPELRLVLRALLLQRLALMDSRTNKKATLTVADQAVQNARTEDAAPSQQIANSTIATMDSVPPHSPVMLQQDKFAE